MESRLQIVYVDDVEIRPEIAVEMGGDESEGTAICQLVVAQVDPAGDGDVFEGAVTTVAVKAVPICNVAARGAHDQVPDIEVDTAVAVVVDPTARLGAHPRQGTEGNFSEIVDAGRGRHVLKQGLAGNKPASVLGPMAFQKNIGWAIGHVLSPCAAELLVVGEDVDVGVAVVVVVGEHGTGEIDAAWKRGQQRVHVGEGAVPVIAVEVGVLVVAAVDHEHVGTVVVVEVDPIDPEAVDGLGGVEVRPHPGRVPSARR